MTTRYRTLAAAAAAAVVLAGCGSSGGDDDDPAPPRPTTTRSGIPDPPDAAEASPLPPGASGTPRGGIPAPDDVDERDATAVSRAAVTVLFTYDTRMDTSSNDAGRRLADAGWCTDAYANQLREATSRSAPGAQWATWSRHRAYTKATARSADEAGKPEDSPTAAYRQWNVTVTPHGRDGWKGRAEMTTAYVELTRTAPRTPWRVNTITLR
ncbi:hypothetical protein [Streptomyces alboflavus]|uniref:hypothetical protein n=1 Tax=Streptomyces alboflavus TaxID=67267 RepID=UPI000F656E5D|nr:hypothetical protein [Streptomyces alboflavus]